MKGLPARHLVFLDESGVNTCMTRRYGRAIGKQRCCEGVPLNHGKNTTLISAIRLDHPPLFSVIQGAMHGCQFLDFIKNILVPTLHEGDIVIMDNLATHKVDGVEDAIRAAHAQLLFLPPYSPDFNPIEQMWSKMKAYLRKVKARVYDSLHSAILQAFALISPNDLLGWFSHAGYSSLA
jgi:transposase